MKKLFSKPLGFLGESLKATPRPVRAIILAITGTLILALVALAAVVLFEFPWYMTVVPGEQAGELFLDEECTIPAAPFYWGDVERGTQQQLDLYVKNTGVEPIDVSLVVPQDVSAYMTWTITPSSILLNTGEVGHFTLVADILPTSPLGDVEGTYRGEAP